MGAAAAEIAAHVIVDVGGVLLHAHSICRALGEGEKRIRAIFRWEMLTGRKLVSRTDETLSVRNLLAVQSNVKTEIEAMSTELPDALTEKVQSATAELFRVFNPRLTVAREHIESILNVLR